MYYLIVSFLLALNVYLYTQTEKWFSMFTIGFCAGMIVAAVINDIMKR